MNRTGDSQRSSRMHARAKAWPSDAIADRMQIARLGGGVFAVLMAYYLLKPAREALLVSASIDLSGAELRGFATVAQGVAAVALATVYSQMADRLTRRKLITVVNGVFAASLAMLAAQPHLQWLLPAPIGSVVAYVVTGGGGVVIVAQFWAFATDVEGRRAGRILPLLSLAASAGGVGGALVARSVLALFADPSAVLHLGAALCVCLAAVLAAAADRNGSSNTATPAASESPDEETVKGGVIGLLLGHKYVFAAAVVTLMAQWVATNGENLLFGYVQATLGAHAIASPLRDTSLARETMAFYASFSLWSNLAALLVQVAVTYGCVRGRSGRNLLLVLPAVTLATATAMIFVPALGLVKCLKVAENATRYSINNTAAQLLWMPTSAAMKYKAKIVIETVVVRVADLLAALTAFVGLRLLHAPLQDMYLFNALLVVVWAAAAAVLVQEQGARLRSRRKVQALPVRAPQPAASALKYDLAA